MHFKLQSSEVDQGLFFRIKKLYGIWQLQAMWIVWNSQDRNSSKLEAVLLVLIDLNTKQEHNVASWMYCGGVLSFSGQVCRQEK